MKKGGRQTGTAILFAEHVILKYLMKFALLVFVVFVMLLWKNIVIVKKMIKSFFCCRKKMKCLLCSLQFIREVVLKKHYVDYHSINDEDIYFQDLFTPDTLDKTC